MDPIIIAPHEPTEAEIQKKAYQLWLEGGCREGTELDDWFAAKEFLVHHHGRVIEARHKAARTSASPKAPQEKNTVRFGAVA
jgi:hypothetical protein